MLRPTAFAALLSVALALPLAAQSSELQPGARVRVEAPGIVAGTFEGTIVQRLTDTLVIGASNASAIHIPMSRISSLEISRGKSRSDGALAGMKWGVPIMAATGAAFGIAAVNSDNCRTCEPFSGGEAVAATAVFALVGAIYGAGIGALIGREHWETFDLAPRTSLRLQRSRIGIGVALNF